MTAPLDTGLEFFRQVLALRASRQEILSADIANASTPGFKAVDLDFAGALSAANAKRPASEAPASRRGGVGRVRGSAQAGERKTARVRSPRQSAGVAGR